MQLFVFCQWMIALIITLPRPLVGEDFYLFLLWLYWKRVDLLNFRDLANCSTHYPLFTSSFCQYRWRIFTNSTRWSNQLYNNQSSCRRYSTNRPFIFRENSWNRSKRKWKRRKCFNEYSESSLISQLITPFKMTSEISYHNHSLMQY